MSETMNVAIVSDGEALDRLRPAWQELYDRCPTATPFQSAPWLLAWWEVFGHASAAVITVTVNKRLVALAPFYISRDALGIRRLSLIGSGHSDYPDVLVSHENAAGSMAAIWERLTDMRSSWDIGVLFDLREESPLLTHPAPSSFNAHIEPSGVAPYLSLPPDVDAFRGGLSKGLRRTLRVHQQRLDQRGSVSSAPAHADEYSVVLETLFRLHTEQWRRLGRPGALGHERVREFHRRVLPGFVNDGTLWLWTLRCGGDIVGVLYALWRNGRLLCYLSGFDQAYRSLNAGSLMIASVIDHAIANHCTECDFLRGAEDYKYAWGARDRRLRRLILKTPSQ